MTQNIRYKNGRHIQMSYLPLGRALEWGFKEHSSVFGIGSRGKPTSVYRVHYVENHNSKMWYGRGVRRLEVETTGLSHSRTREFSPSRPALPVVLNFPRSILRAPRGVSDHAGQYLLRLSSSAHQLGTASLGPCHGHSLGWPVGHTRQMLTAALPHQSKGCPLTTCKSVVRVWNLRNSGVKFSLIPNLIYFLLW